MFSRTLARTLHKPTLPGIEEAENHLTSVDDSMAMHTTRPPRTKKLRKRMSIQELIDSDDLELNDDNWEYVYNPPFLLDNPRVALQIKGKNPNLVVGHCKSHSEHISFDKVHDHTRATIKFIFVNITNGQSEYGVCNVVAIDHESGEYLGVLYTSEQGTTMSGKASTDAPPLSCVSAPLTPRPLHFFSLYFP